MPHFITGHIPTVTRHASCFVTRHTSHVTRHTSHVTRHTSHVTRHTSHVTRHTSPTPPAPCSTMLAAPSRSFSGQLLQLLHKRHAAATQQVNCRSIQAATQQFNCSSNQPAAAFALSPVMVITGLAARVEVFTVPSAGHCSSWSMEARGTTGAAVWSSRVKRLTSHATFRQIT